MESLKRKSIHMRKFQLCLLTCVLCLLLLPHLTARADMGPHPSLYVDFVNLGDEPCYGTVISFSHAEGPLHAFFGNGSQKVFIDGEYVEHLNPDDYDYSIWQAFVDFKDCDGFYFLQSWDNVTESKRINWPYWAPEFFKILLYFPETHTYAVSGEYKRYAFNSYYTVDMGQIDFSTQDSGKDSVAFINSVEKTYPYPWAKEILSLLARAFLTVGLEVGVALLFKLHQKKTLLTIIITNIVTQILLNAALNIHVWLYSNYSLIDFYLKLEICVFVIEALLYCLVLNKFTEKPHKQAYYVAYSLVANTISFLVGIGLAYVIPSMF